MIDVVYDLNNHIIHSFDMVDWEDETLHVILFCLINWFFNKILTLERFNSLNLAASGLEE